MYEPQHKIKIRWSPNFAYAIGLITSDGYLHKDGKHIRFASKDLEQVINFKRCLNLSNKIGKNVRGGEIEKNYFYTGFGDKIFYKYLNSLGLMSAKSKIIKAVKVPDKRFPDFLRGLFDGDGTFYTFWDKRWPKSFAFKMSFASASTNFIIWLKNKLTELYSVKGYIHKGAGVFNLEYTKGDSKKLYNAMYYDPKVLCLSRKYNKIKNALDKDKKLGLVFLQKSRNAAVAQW